LDFLGSHNVLLSGCRGGVLKLWEPETCQEIGAYFYNYSGLWWLPEVLFLSCVDLLSEAFEGSIAHFV
jgi:hypothetical protein